MLRFLVYIPVVGALAMLHLIYRQAKSGGPLCEGLLPAACMRDWFGALSGWTAAAMGMATIFVLLRQLEAAQSQTQFAVGDANPSISITYGPTGTIEMFLTNWNRRPIYVTALEPMSKDVVIQDLITADHYGGWQRPPLSERCLSLKSFASCAVFIPGWENRSAPPPGFLFGVILRRDIELSAPDMEVPARREALKVSIAIAGERHRKLVLRTVHPSATALPISEKTESLFRI